MEKNPQQIQGIPSDLVNRGDILPTLPYGRARASPSRFRDFAFLSVAMSNPTFLIKIPELTSL